MSQELFRVHGIVIPGVRPDRGVARKILELKRNPQVAGITFFEGRWDQDEDYQAKVDRLLDTYSAARKENPNAHVTRRVDYLNHL